MSDLRAWVVVGQVRGGECPAEDCPWDSVFVYGLYLADELAHENWAAFYGGDLAEG